MKGLMRQRNPGSDAAVQKGCTCPVIDNHHGRGFRQSGETRFWINAACPLHGMPDSETADPTLTQEPGR